MSTRVIDTLVVNFGESASSSSGSIIAEWDDIANVDDDGESISQYGSGDSKTLRIHHGSSVIIIDVKSTSGSMSDDGSVTLDKTQLLGWGDDEDTQNLTYTPVVGVSFTWYGNVGSGYELVDRAITIADVFPCLADVEYRVNFNRYTISFPSVSLADDETYPVRVYIYYEENI